MLKHWDENRCFHAESTVVIEHPELVTVEDLTHRSSPVRPPHCASFQRPSHSQSMIEGRSLVAQTSRPAVASAIRYVNSPATNAPAMNRMCIFPTLETGVSASLLRSNRIWLHRDLMCVVNPQPLTINDAEAGTHAVQSGRYPSALNVQSQRRQKTHTLSQLDDDPHRQPPRTLNVCQKHEMAHHQ
jgi:hypothetical protein